MKFVRLLEWPTPIPCSRALQTPGVHIASVFLDFNRHCECKRYQLFCGLFPAIRLSKKKIIARVLEPEVYGDVASKVKMPRKRITDSICRS